MLKKCCNVRILTPGFGGELGDFVTTNTRESLIFEVRGTVHESLQVIDRRGIRYLRFGMHGGWQGALCQTNLDEIVFAYQRGFSAVVQHLPKVERFLALGLGVGTGLRTVRRWHPASVLHAVELDEPVIDTAIDYFKSPEYGRATYFIADGVEFIRKPGRHYDLVFVDAYLQRSIYQPVLSDAFIRHLANCVSPGGTVVMNIITSTYEERHLEPFMAAARASFSEIGVLPVGLPMTNQNMIFILSHHNGLIRGLSGRLRYLDGLRWNERLFWPMRFRSVQTSTVL